MSSAGSFFGLLSASNSVFMSYAAIAAALVGSWFTFKKMGHPGWQGLIPFYSTYILFRDLWELKEFWRLITYLCIAVGSLIMGEIFVLIGGVFGVGGYNSIGFGVAGVMLLILGISFIIAGVVFIVLAVVQEFKLYSRMAYAFGLKNAWAWGLLFLSPVMLPIIGFNKSIVYYGPVNQVPFSEPQ